MDILSCTAVELADAIRTGRTTAIEATEAVLEQIAKKESEYHCYITIDGKKALKRAAKVQKQIDTNALMGPLAGVPFSIKDNLCTKGMLTSCASKALKSFIPAYNAQVVDNLEKAGVIIIGKTNMDEFAMGNTTESSFYGVTRNPHHIKYNPGGSSGGAAAAVAARECFGALGTDTGGSIRQPASHCGVVGLKPTYGMVSNEGLLGCAYSLDQIGPMTRDVTDCATVLEILAADDKTSEPARRHTDFTTGLVPNVKGMRIGIPQEFLVDGLDKEVYTAVMNVAGVLQKKGAYVEECSLKEVKYAVPAYYVIAAMEISSYLEHFEPVQGILHMDKEEKIHQPYKKINLEEMSKEASRRLKFGTLVLHSGYYDEYYLKALQARKLIKEGFTRAFAQYDIILGPVAPSTAVMLGESHTDSVKRYLNDIYTTPVNLAGLPAMSIPCGWDKNRLPIGVQFIGAPFQEKKLIQAAYTYECACI
ncbi:MAG: Asp-tRNA(Asn)/Glu-tRNA(Gln) amidotransferase subunit GatA [Lachnospiraceae bacterium]|nr:Asp-tRNA(Asn)/Glu-tRNA(Gln) amidotransferase subunit GatA [Lachnospiraceae bacterium]